MLDVGLVVTKCDLTVLSDSLYSLGGLEMRNTIKL